MAKQTVVFCEDPFAPQTWTEHEVEDVRAFLTERFDTFPSTARIYHGQVSEETDVTPADEAGIKRLGELEGLVYVVVYPADPITIIVAVVAVAAAAAVAFLLTPKVPNALSNTSGATNRQSESPNNELSDRQNRPRPNARIPDIFGTVRSTPDLLAVPYKIFEDHEEVEYAYMCIGRGNYTVPTDEIKDGDTRIQDIAGATVEIYGPNTSPNSGDNPQVRVGSALSEPVFNVQRSNAVNGQTLRAPNADSFTGSSNIRFEGPDSIFADNEADVDFSQYFVSGDALSVTNASTTATLSGTGSTLSASMRFEDGGIIRLQTGSVSGIVVGDLITLSGASLSGSGFSLYLNGQYVVSAVGTSTLTLQQPEIQNADWSELTTHYSGGVSDYVAATAVVPSGSFSLDLAGTYTLLSVGTETLVLSNPSAVNPHWALLSRLTDSRTEFLSPTLASSEDKWVGPFIIEEADRIFVNYVANNGLYKDDGTNQSRADVEVQLEITPVDSDDEPTGSAETFNITVEGSATTRNTRAATLKAVPTFSGRCSVRAKRITNADLSFSGTVVDEVKWRDLYAVLNVEEQHFGNVTTVQSVTYATAGALAVKDRKLNLKATRLVPQRLSGTNFGANHATDRVDDILAAVCLDEYIGGRQLSELDLDNIYDTIAEAETYFGTDDAVAFGHTFDSDNVSFEETVATIAASVFCTAYRQGSVIQLKLERATEDSALLFNHRNKLPGSETRTIRFGNQDGNDGVEYEWIDPEDDALITFYLPPDKSATNPRKVESVGVRNRAQAFIHAQRAWNKVRYQNTATEFEATQEADLLVISDRVLISDNTRTGTQDGQIESQDGLELELSQEVDLSGEGPYYIFMQHSDGTVEAIQCTAGTSKKHVVLSQAPRRSLSLSDLNFAKATFEIVQAENLGANAFLLTEKDPRDTMTSSIRAVNYDPAYYLEEGMALRIHSEGGFTNDSVFYGAVTGTGISIVEPSEERNSFSVPSANLTISPNSPVSFGQSSGVYSASAWIKRNANSAGKVLKVGANSLLEISAAGAIGAAGGNWSADGVVTENTWVHITASYDGTSLTLYKDGNKIAQGSTAFGQAAPVASASLVAGELPQGYIDDIRAYSRALSAAEAKSLWKRTRV